MTTEERVDKAIETMFAREKTLKEALMDHADAEHTYRVELAKKYLAGEGSIEARKANATIQCEAYLLARLKADAKREFAGEALRDARQALSARQSILKADVDKVF
jgi:hypothetical protein